MSKIMLAQLRDKDVINLCNAARLGYINEIEFDSCSGQICSLILCRSEGFLGFGKENDLILPWNRIECIGDDAVLVKISEDELMSLESQTAPRKGKRNNCCK